MTRLIANISNYPFSDGQTTGDGTLLTEGDFRLRDKSLERQLSDLLELSKDIRFFNRSGDSGSRWYDLLSQSPLLQVVRFASLDTTGLFNRFRDLPLLNGFTSDSQLSEKELEILAYQRLQMIRYLFAMYKSVVEDSIPEHQAQLRPVIQNNSVKSLASRYLALHEECMTASPALVKADDSYAIDFQEGISFPVLAAEADDDLRDFYLGGTAINQPPLLLPYQGEEAKLKAANEIAGTIFKGLLQVYRSVSGWAKSRIELYAYQDPSNEPHIGLLLAFFRLLQLYDQRFNKLAYSQSEFIFKEILQLERQPEKPDTAWVSLELARNTDQFHLPRYALFKAGKNKSGKPVYYRTSEDTVLNSARIGRIYSMVRLRRDGQMFGVSATGEAGHPQWQVNDAWRPFNDMSPSYSGLAIESRLLGLLTQKDGGVEVEITFAGAYAAGPHNLSSQSRFGVAQEDGTWKFLKIADALLSGGNTPKLTISAKPEEDLKTLKHGINARLSLLSPLKTDDAGSSPFIALYRYFLSAEITGIKVKAKGHSFLPEMVKTAGGISDAADSFPAFGATSRKGSSFTLIHPLLAFANPVNLKVEWSEKPETGIKVIVNNEASERDLGPRAGSETVSEIKSIANTAGSSELNVRLNQDLTHTIESKITGIGKERTVSTIVPRVLIIKEVNLTADLEETVYAQKTNQAGEKQNLLAWLYPLGEQPVSGNRPPTFLPDYTLHDFGTYESELCIGLQNVRPGQSISLLFEMADETAGLTEREARISWFIIENNKFTAIGAGKLSDGTAGFLQSGIVQLSLPGNITGDNSILYGQDTFWLVARCEANSDVVANIRSIRTNGVALTRVLDEHNSEARVSVAPGTIESLYPKSAFIKSVDHRLPSRGGRETETDERFWRRSSERLRHKSRAVNQWDWEALVLENFPFVYKVKCFNHAWYDESARKLQARPASTVIMLLPNHAGGKGMAGLQPALQMSRLSGVKAFLAGKASAFTNIQVLNTQWDEVKVRAEIVLAEGISDLPFYREQLDLDISRYLAPWAFDDDSAISAGQTLYFSALVDYLDELPYVHHIVSLKVFKNEIEQYDQVSGSSELHLLTSAAGHELTTKLYADQ